MSHISPPSPLMVRHFPPPSGSLSPSPHPMALARWVFLSSRPFFYADNWFFFLWDFEFFEFWCCISPPPPPMVRHFPPPSGSLSPSPHPTPSLRWVPPSFRGFFMLTSCFFPIRFWVFLTLMLLSPLPPHGSFPSGLLSPFPPSSGTLQHLPVSALNFFLLWHFLTASI